MSATKGLKKDVQDKQEFGIKQEMGEDSESEKKVIKREVTVQHESSEILKIAMEVIGCDAEDDEDVGNEPELVEELKSVKENREPEDLRDRDERQGQRPVERRRQG